MSQIILPGDYQFQETLTNISLFWNDKRELLPSEGGAFIYDSDTNLPRVATWKETQEFLHDGEYDLRMAEIENCENDWDEWPQEGPCEITDDDLKANWEFMEEKGYL